MFSKTLKGKGDTPIHQSKLYYVEIKYYLSASFNHSFENLHSIVCWDTEIKHNAIVVDINHEERKMQIAPAASSNEYTGYYLDNPRRAHKIEVFVLKDYLRERLGIEFRPRSSLT